MLLVRARYAVQVNLFGSVCANAPHKQRMHPTWLISALFNGSPRFEVGRLLKVASHTRQAGVRFTLSEGVNLVQGESCRNYPAGTKSKCGIDELSFRRSSDLWGDKGNCAYLFSPTGVLEAEYCY